jgi:uncharacterized surface anchored protein
MKTMKWAQRICIGSSIAVASLFAVPSVAGADSTTTTTSCYPNCPQSTVANTSVVPPSTSGGAGGNSNVSGNGSKTTVSVNGSSSLPFTGADIGELAVVGVGAVVIGGVLARRRRSAA